MSDWMPGATRRDGPASKHGYEYYHVAEPQDKRGLVVHSMEGSLQAALGELDKLERRASWTFSNPKAGPLLQHYPAGFHTWASGSLQANVLFASCEHEGGGPGKETEPLTENQIANLVELITWLSEQFGWEPRRPADAEDRSATLYEHRECVRFRADPTACPSGRIPWQEVFERLGIQMLEDDMAPVPWVDCDKSNGEYRSYIIVAGRKIHVASKEQETAFVKAGYIVEPRQHLSLAELKSIPSAPGTPEPDAP